MIRRVYNSPLEIVGGPPRTPNTSPSSPSMGMGRMPMFGVGMVPMNLQSFSAGGGGASFNSDEAIGMLRKAFDSGMNGSIRNFDTASARLRERVDSYGKAQEQEAQDRWLGMGRSGGRGWDQIRQGMSMDRSNALAQGLAELEKQFEDARLQGLGLASGAADRLGSLSLATQTAASDSDMKARELELERRRSLDEILFNSAQSDARNRLEWELGLLNSNTSKDIAKTQNRNSGLNSIIAQIIAMLGR